MIRSTQDLDSNGDNSSDTDAQSQRGPRPVRLQFGMRLLLIVTGLVCVAAAVVGGLWRGGASRTYYVILGIAAPMGVMILISVVSQILRFLERRRR